MNLTKNHISGLLKRLRLYKPVHWLYNRIGCYNRKVEFNIKGNTFRFWTPTFYMIDHISNCAGEREIFEHFIGQLHPDDIVWDVGANIGFYSIISGFFLSHGGQVYAFEPHKASQALLKRNINLNQIDNIVVVPIALGHFNGEAELFSSDSPNFGAHSFVQRSDYQLKKKGSSVKIHKADSLIADHHFKIPNVVKIDVEGAEYWVLCGMHQILKDNQLRIIQCEIHPGLLPKFHASPNNIVTIMTDAGFSTVQEFDRKDQKHILFQKS